MLNNINNMAICDATTIETLLSPNRNLGMHEIDLKNDGYDEYAGDAAGLFLEEQRQKMLPVIVSQAA